MNKYYIHLTILILVVLTSSCTTTLRSIKINGSMASVGENYEIKHSCVLFTVRGYIDSIRPTKRKLEELKSYEDFDPYSMLPKRYISAGTVVKISKIYKTKNEKIFITAVLNGEKVDITQVIQGAN